MLEDLVGQTVDEVLVLGDSVLKLGDSPGAVRLLGSIRHRAVYGNMEWAVLAAGTPAWPVPWGRFDRASSFAAADVELVRAEIGLPFFARQAASIRLATPSGPLIACHGTPRSCRAELQPPARPDDPHSPWTHDDARFARELGEPPARLVVCGHIHVPYARRSGDRLVVNPGAVGWSRPHVAHPFRTRYAILTLEAGRPPAIDFRGLRYDNARAVADLRRKQAQVEASLVDDAERARSRDWHARHAVMLGG